jgi:hypothetical protein
LGIAASKPRPPASRSGVPAPTADDVGTRRASRAAASDAAAAGEAFPRPAGPTYFGAPPGTGSSGGGGITPGGGGGVQSATSTGAGSVLIARAAVTPTVTSSAARQACTTVDAATATTGLRGSTPFGPMSGAAVGSGVMRTSASTASSGRSRGRGSSRRGR